MSMVEDIARFEVKNQQLKTDFGIKSSRVFKFPFMPTKFDVFQSIIYLYFPQNESCV